MGLNEPKNEKPQMEEPETTYELKQAVIDTNEAVQRLADLITQMALAVNALASREGGER